jgi:hypothetical protein
MTKIKSGVAKQIRKKRRHTDVAEWLAELDRFRGEQLIPDGRNQPILRGNINAEKKRFFNLADQLCATSDPAKRKRIKESLARIAFG